MKKESGKKAGRRKCFLFFAAVFVSAILGIRLWTAGADQAYVGEHIVCEPISLISWEERLRPEYLADYADCLTDLEDGDILVTCCTHTFGWRNGHAAMVIDAEQELTLEAVMLGSKSCVQSVTKWRGYPGAAVLRLKGVSAGERSRIAQWAMEHLLEVDYGFSADLLDRLRNGESWNTHCAHLVWEAYQTFGYDVDGDGGVIVTPRDLYESPLFEVVEAYGMEGW